MAHLPLLSSLFTVGLCRYLKEAYSTSQLLCMHKNLNTIDQLAIVSKQLKNYALRLYGAFITGSQALHMYLECSHPKLNHDNIIETLMMALIT